jgi:hypothetical protein
MNTPIKNALATIDAIDAGKPIDPAALKALLWQLVNALRRM